jgi:hypothetical protein
VGQPRDAARYHGDQAAGPDGQYLRAAVRPEWPDLLDAIVEVTR